MEPKKKLRKFRTYTPEEKLSFRSKFSSFKWKKKQLRAQEQIDQKYE